MAFLFARLNLRTFVRDSSSSDKSSIWVHPALNPGAAAPSTPASAPAFKIRLYRNPVTDYPIAAVATPEWKQMDLNQTSPQHGHGLPIRYRGHAGNELNAKHLEMNLSGSDMASGDANQIGASG